MTEKTLLSGELVTPQLVDPVIPPSIDRSSEQQRIAAPKANAKDEIRIVPSSASQREQIQKLLEPEILSAAGLNREAFDIERLNLILLGADRELAMVLREKIITDTASNSAALRLRYQITATDRVIGEKLGLGEYGAILYVQCGRNLAESQRFAEIINHAPVAPDVIDAYLAIKSEQHNRPVVNVDLELEKLEERVQALQKLQGGAQKNIRSGEQTVEENSSWLTPWRWGVERAAEQIVENDKKLLAEYKLQEQELRAAIENLRQQSALISAQDQALLSSVWQGRIYDAIELSRTIQRNYSELLIALEGTRADSYPDFTRWTAQNAKIQAELQGTIENLDAAIKVTKCSQRVVNVAAGATIVVMTGGTATPFVASLMVVGANVPALAVQGYYRYEDGENGVGLAIEVAKDTFQVFSDAGLGSSAATVGMWLNLGRSFWVVTRGGGINIPGPWRWHSGLSETTIRLVTLKLWQAAVEMVVTPGMELHRISQPRSGEPDSKISTSGLLEAPPPGKSEFNSNNTTKQSSDSPLPIERIIDGQIGAPAVRGSPTPETNEKVDLIEEFRRRNTPTLQIPSQHQSETELSYSIAPPAALSLPPQNTPKVEVSLPNALSAPELLAQAQKLANVLLAPEALQRLVPLLPLIAGQNSPVILREALLQIARNRYQLISELRISSADMNQIATTNLPSVLAQSIALAQPNPKLRGREKQIRQQALLELGTVLFVAQGRDIRAVQAIVKNLTAISKQTGSKNITLPEIYTSKKADRAEIQRPEMEQRASAQRASSLETPKSAKELQSSIAEPLPDRREVHFELMQERERQGAVVSIAAEYLSSDQAITVKAAKKATKLQVPDRTKDSVAAAAKGARLRSIDSQSDAEQLPALLPNKEKQSDHIHQISSMIHPQTKSDSVPLESVQTEATNRKTIGTNDTHLPESVAPHQKTVEELNITAPTSRDTATDTKNIPLEKSYEIRFEESAAKRRAVLRRKIKGRQQREKKERRLKEILKDRLLALAHSELRAKKLQLLNPSKLRSAPAETEENHQLESIEQPNYEQVKTEAPSKANTRRSSRADKYRAARQLREES